MTFYKHMRLIGVAACGFSALPIAAQAVRPRPAPAIAAHGPLTADVAGVRLQASPAGVRAALARADYRIDTVTQEATFDQQVSAEAASRGGRPGGSAAQAGVGMLIATGPHQEHVEVRFMQTPAGSQVSDVSLRVPATVMAADAFRAELVNRYGPPDAAHHDGAELSWCSPETLTNCGRQIVVSGPLDNLYPLLFASAYGATDDRIVHLEIGETALRDLAAAKEQAVRRLVPPMNGASSLLPRQDDLEGLRSIRAALS